MVEDARIAQRRLDALGDPRRRLEDIELREVRQLLSGDSSLALQANPRLRQQLVPLAEIVWDSNRPELTEAIRSFQEHTSGSYAARTPLP